MGTELDLFSVQGRGRSGLILWHPIARGPRPETLWKMVRKRLMGARVRFLVYTASTSCGAICGTRAGSTRLYKDNMFGAIEVKRSPTIIGRMNCPGHI